MKASPVKSKVCLITGANRGLGKAVAAGLAGLGATVTLACRDREQGERARSDIIAATGNPTVELLLLDLSSLSSIRQAADVFCASHDRLDVLVNNAGIYKSQRVTTAEGFEVMFATNHLGPFLLTNLLLDRLKASAPARVLVVTAPSTVQLDFDNLQGEKQFRPLWAFGATKMCNLLFTYELARQLEGTGVTVNAVHPGLVKSNLMREAPFFIRWFSQVGAKTPEQSAESVVYLASSTAVASITGKFFKGKQIIESVPYSHDATAQRRLWDTSVELTKGY